MGFGLKVAAVIAIGVIVVTVILVEGLSPAEKEIVEDVVEKVGEALIIDVVEAAVL